MPLPPSDLPLDRLIAAGAKGDIDEVRRLLPLAGDLNVRRHAGINALGYVAYSDRLEIIHLLIDHGADPNGIGYEECTTLGLAVYGRHMRCAVALMDRGADVNLAAPRDGVTPLHFAAMRGPVAMVEMLLARGAGVNTRTKLHHPGDPSVFEDTPLHMAAAAGDPQIIERLLAAGADRKAMNAKGATPRGAAEAVGRGAWVLELLG